MSNPSEKFAVFFIATALILLSAFSVCAQSNQLWFVTYNGAPTPSSDVSVRTLNTDGSTNFIATGAASNFVSQTNFSTFNSPYDIAVDTDMGKIYVLDNNLQSETPEYIYSFDLSGTPSQIRSSVQIIYTMPVSAADVSSNLYPLISGLALDSTNHYLYFNQFDIITGTNSYIGRLDLASSSNSDIFSSGGGNPTLKTFYVGKIPGQGTLAIDNTNFYIGAINARTSSSGVYIGPISGIGNFSEVITNSFGDPNFTNGFVSGVASDSRDNLIYYLTFDGYPYSKANTNQNAIWVYNLTNRIKTKMAFGFQGYPDNIALDFANNRYYFTIGRNGDAENVPANHQAIYVGILGSTNAPTLLYKPALSGQDLNGINVGNVAIGGIYIVDYKRPPVAGVDFVSAQKNLTLNLPVADLLANDSDPDGGTLSINAVSNTSTNGGSVSLNGSFVTYTPLNNFAGLDQFTYTLTNNAGGQAQGAVTVSVLSLNLPTSNDLTIALEPNDHFFLFSGSSGQNYVVQFANSVNGPWLDLSPVLTTDSNGFIEYNDLISPAPSMQFYRVRSD